MSKAKPFEIPKQWVWEAFKQVRSRKGGPGHDGQSLEAFEANLGNNLYKLWNRMCSGSYMPPPVLLVEIPKAGGGVRPLGIPTVSDRVAQMVVKRYLEPELERHFHADSYGYRPGKSALDAVAITRQRCWRYGWVVDLDIKGFFDTIDHELLMKAVRRHTQERWVLLYIERWLKADLILSDGTRRARTLGTPQGGVVSPILANLFLHYVFDRWMDQNWPGTPFARYADDVVCHCDSLEQAQRLRASLEKRFAQCGLTLHPEKTRIVDCRKGNPPDRGPSRSFDFLGYTFRNRPTRAYDGSLFVGFNPAVSRKALKAIGDQIRSWKLHRKVQHTLEELAREINPVLRGWIDYYGRFNHAELDLLFKRLEERLALWVRRKYKSVRRNRKKSWDILLSVRQRMPRLFAHWRLLYTGRKGSMTRAV